MSGSAVRLPFLFCALIAVTQTLPALAAPPSGIEELRIERHENEALLGVYVESSDEGAEVHGIIDDSAAEGAGLERGDVIVSFDGEPVDGTDELRKLIALLAPGDTVGVGYLRDGDEQSLRLQLDQREPRITIEVDQPLYIVSEESRGKIRGTITLDEDDRLEDIFVCEGDPCRFSTERLWYRLDCLDASCPTYRVDFWGRPLLGVQITGMTAELREHFGADPENGLLISKVFDGSPAEDAGIETGDVIVAVDGRTIDEASDIERALKNREGDVVEVDVIRDGRPMALDAELPDYDD